MTLNFIDSTLFLIGWCQKVLSHLFAVFVCAPGLLDKMASPDKTRFSIHSTTGEDVKVFGSTKQATKTWAEIEAMAEAANRALTATLEACQQSRAERARWHHQQEK